LCAPVARLLRRLEGGGQAWLIAAAFDEVGERVVVVQVAGDYTCGSLDTCADGVETGAFCAYGRGREPISRKRR
jgi:hypothetical protein